MSELTVDKIKELIEWLELPYKMQHPTQQPEGVFSAPVEIYKYLLSQLATFNSDLKEAEGAVVDLMTLNDTLTGEMEALKKCDTTGYDRFEAGKSFANRLLKAEVERLRCLISEAIHATNPNIVTNKLTEALNPHEYALLQPLNHKEG